MRESIHLFPIKVGGGFESCLVYFIAVLGERRFAARHVIAIRALKGDSSMSDRSRLPSISYGLYLNKDPSLTHQDIISKSGILNIQDSAQARGFGLLLLSTSKQAIDWVLEIMLIA